MKYDIFAPIIYNSNRAINFYFQYRLMMIRAADDQALLFSTYTIPPSENGKLLTASPRECL